MLLYSQVFSKEHIGNGTPGFVSRSVLIESLCSSPQHCLAPECSQAFSQKKNIHVSLILLFMITHQLRHFPFPVSMKLMNKIHTQPGRQGSLPGVVCSVPSLSAFLRLGPQLIGSAPPGEEICILALSRLCTVASSFCISSQQSLLLATCCPILCLWDLLHPVTQDPLVPRLKETKKQSLMK